MAALFGLGIVLGLILGMALGPGEQSGVATGTPAPTSATGNAGAAPTATLIITVGVAATETPIPTQPTATPLGASSAPPVGTQIGNLAQGFVLNDLNGDPVNLDSLRDRVVVLTFWDILEPDSANMIKDLQKLQEAHHEDPSLTILAINSGNPQDELTRFATRHALDSKMILVDSDKAQTGAYQVVRWPTTFFLDKKGIIQEIRSEVLSSEELESIIIEVAEK